MLKSIELGRPVILLSELRNSSHAGGSGTPAIPMKPLLGKRFSHVARTVYECG
ncbi:MAG TPA: hypothetical protein VGD17_03610 [Chitinophagaceae bacterium]